MVKIKFDIKKLERDLARTHGGINQATADTVNTAAKLTKRRYNKALRTPPNIVRAKFTLRATKIWPASFQRKSSPGRLRPVRDINAIVGVQNLKGEMHYLALQEFGIDKEPHKSADDTTSLPVTKHARQGGTKHGKVFPRFTLRKAKMRSLRFQGRQFGTARDGYSDAQRWKILNRHKTKWNLKQPFKLHMRGVNNVYALVGGKIVTIRFMQKKQQRVKKRPLFKENFNKLTDAELQNIFVKAARRILR